MTSPQDLVNDYRSYLAAVVLFHQAAADEVGLGSTDYQAINILDLAGPMTSGELAARLSLSTGATTRLIDRLIEGGYVLRATDDSDRRRVLVQGSGQLPPRLADVLGSVREPVGTVIARLTSEQLDGLAIYVRGAAQAYEQAAAAIRSQ